MLYLCLRCHNFLNYRESQVRGKVFFSLGEKKNIKDPAMFQTKCNKKLQSSSLDHSAPSNEYLLLNLGFPLVPFMNVLEIEHLCRNIFVNI